MSRRDTPIQADSGEATTNNQYAVVLPCEPDDFRDFIAGLLGKPQTISKEVVGAFDLNKDDIANFYHLVVQRVRQQNESTLIQFTVTIVYDDQSTVLINSFDDFMHYTEVRAIASIAAHLSWTFLVKFQDKKVPERQQIDVSIFTERRLSKISHVSGRELLIDNLKGNFSLRINHTARTWGADIEALLTGHIENLIKQAHPIKAFVQKRSVLIGFVVQAATFLASMVACFYSTNALVNSRMRDVREIQASTDKTNYLVELVASGIWPRFFFYILSFLFIMFIASIFLGIWAGTSADNEEPSFLLLSKQAEKSKQKFLAAHKKAWQLFVLSLVTSVITSVIGNILFVLYLETWIKP